MQLLKLHDNYEDLYSIESFIRSSKYMLDNYIIHIHLFILHRYITCTNSQYNQLPVSLLAQLVEHCTSIAEVMGLNPAFKPDFFQPFFSQLLKLHTNCADISCIFSSFQCLKLQYQLLIIIFACSKNYS